MIEVKSIHRIMASLIFNKRREMIDIPEQDREGVQYVLDTEYSI